MAESEIEWLKASGAIPWTWNPTTGCNIKSRGCKHCYAMRMAARLKRMGQPRYQLDGDPDSSGPGFGLTLHPDRLDEPYRWRKPRVVFVDSMSDLFHEQVPVDFIVEAFRAMAHAPQHTFLILTKRTARMRDLMLGWGGADGKRRRLQPDGFGWPLPNVWLGTSIENRGVRKRADQLRQTPAAVRFISAEPLLGPLDDLDLTQIDWLIAGGESGPGAEPMDPAWARQLRDRCLDSVCPLCAGAVTVGGWRCPRCQGTGRETLFFFKQWGAWGPTFPGNLRAKRHAFAPKGEGRIVFRSNKKHQGRVLDGLVWSERPPLAHERVDRSATLSVVAPEQVQVDVRIEGGQP